MNHGAGAEINGRKVWLKKVEKHFMKHYYAIHFISALKLLHFIEKKKYTYLQACIFLGVHTYNTHT